MIVCSLTRSRAAWQSSGWLASSSSVQKPDVLRNFSKPSVPPNCSLAIWSSLLVDLAVGDLDALLLRLAGDPARKQQVAMAASLSCS